MWLFTINFLLLILTIPNIINPGPINELNIMFQNVQGFINLRAKSASPALFTTKLLNFQGYIFNEKVKSLEAADILKSLSILRFFMTI